MQVTKTTRRSKTSGARRFGYSVAVAINVLALVLVQRIPEWELFRFLTEDFDNVAPWINLSLITAIVANLAYLVFDDEVLHRLGEVVVNTVFFIVTMRVLLVFPVDFASYRFDWSVVARVFLIISMVGTLVGLMTQLSRLANGYPLKGRIGCR